MKKLAIALAFVAGSLAGIARAEIGTVDPVPAATLLLPYFEVDLANPSATNTIFTVNNASESAGVAHVTLWTDQGIPTFAFDIYLTGYDSQTVNLSTLFVSGALPQTADAGTDPTDTISPNGALSFDTSFPGSTGPCNAVYPDPSLTAVELRHLQRAHTGKSSPSVGGCAGAKYGDTIARGYATIDSVQTCSLLFPSDAGYFSSVADNRNILWGDYNFSKGTDRTGKGDILVPIEACPGTLVIGNGAGFCPFAPMDYTFYGRYTLDGSDQREPLPTTFAARYTRTGAFDGTDLVVWRDTKSAPTGANGGHACSAKPTWYPLSQTQAVAFDETENPTLLCFLSDNISPVVGGTQSCFPLATQKINVFSGSTVAANMGVPYQSGWLYLNLNHALVSGDPFPGLAQSWVSTYPSLSGRYAVGYHAIPFDNVVETTAPGVVLPSF